MFKSKLKFVLSTLFACSCAAPIKPHVYPAAKGHAHVNVRDSYVMYGGDGSMSAGWPSRSQWMPFESAWNANLWIISGACANNGWGANNNAAETQAIKNSIISESASSGIPAEFILAIVIQESKGCVRAPTTYYPLANPGLMQSAGTHSCAGVSSCPASEVAGMIHDGTNGDGVRISLKQCLSYFEGIGTTDDSKWYKTARRYNAGPNVNTANLGVGSTNCYASDVANRLVAPFGDTSCNPSVIGTLTSTVGYVPSANSPSNTNSTPTTNNHDNQPLKSTPDATSSSSATCTRFYTPLAGDTCASSGIDFATFRRLNPSINENCTNMWAGTAYCVALGGSQRH